MKQSIFGKPTLFYILSLILIVGLSISSLIMINLNDMNSRLQGWVNLLWLPLPIVTLIIDRFCANKFAVKTVNKVELFILGIPLLLFAIYGMFIFFSEAIL